MVRGVIMGRKTTKKKQNKLTPNQQLYKKELKRIQSFIKKAEKRGYQFFENVVPEMPNRVTQQDLYKIRKLTPELLYRKSVGWLNGTKVRGTEKRTAERKVSAEKATITRKMCKTFYTNDTPKFDYIPILSPENVIADYLTNLSNFPNGRGSHLISRWFNEVMNNLRSKYGTDVANQLMATAIEDATNSGYIVDNHVAYSATHATHHVYGVLQFIPELGPLEQEEFADILESMEDYVPQ